MKRKIEKPSSRLTKVTDAILRGLPPHPRGGPSSSYELRDPLVKRLVFSVGYTGVVTFYLRYTYHGEKQSIWLGVHGAMALDEVRAEVYKHQAVLDQGRNPKAAANRLKTMPTVKEFALGEYMTRAKASKKTYGNDASKFRDFIIPAHGSMLLCDVARKDIESNLNKLRTKLSPATVNRVHALYSVFFNLAVANDYIDKSPCTGIKKLKEANKVTRFMSIDEVQRVIAASEKDANQVAAKGIQLLLYTGLRRNEVFTARWENFDEELRTLYLPETKSGRTRHVTLNDGALAILKGLPRLDDCPWCFPGRDPVKALNNPTKAWHRILKVAGVDDFRIHDCRHGFASALVNAGTPLYQVQQLLGHASSATTERYAHLAQSTLRSTSQKVSDLIGGTQS